MTSESPRDMSDDVRELSDLVRLVRRLRAPDGCPWDREQGLADLRAYLLEEAHEAAAAIDAGDLERLAEELGDLLFQVAFVAELARERGGPPVPEIVRRVHAKLVDRHPHVFAEERLTDAAAVHRSWEQRKQEQRATRGEGLLAGMPDTLPALTGAYRLGQKAAGVGFDWPDVAGVLDKIDEERAELAAELERDEDDPDAVAHELGDLLFSTAQLARRLGVDPEAMLARANARFRDRFTRMEAEASRTGQKLSDLDIETLEAAWQRAKNS
ncbi:MAG: nucleoside triphosphate pyrophosphohydrolase [Thermoanaerobaculia bacterium]